MGHVIAKHAMLKICLGTTNIYTAGEIDFFKPNVRMEMSYPDSIMRPTMGSKKLRAKGQPDQKPQPEKKPKKKPTTKLVTFRTPRFAPAQYNQQPEIRWEACEWWKCEAVLSNGLCYQDNPPWAEKCDYCQNVRTCELVDRRKLKAYQRHDDIEADFVPGQLIRPALDVRVEYVSMTSRVLSGLLRLIGFSP